MGGRYDGVPTFRPAHETLDAAGLPKQHPRDLRGSDGDDKGCATPVLVCRDACVGFCEGESNEAKRSIGGPEESNRMTGGLKRACCRNGHGRRSTPAAQGTTKRMSRGHCGWSQGLERAWVQAMAASTARPPHRNHPVPPNKHYARPHTRVGLMRSSNISNGPGGPRIRSSFGTASRAAACRKRALRHGWGRQSIQCIARFNLTPLLD